MAISDQESSDSDLISFSGYSKQKSATSCLDRIIRIYDHPVSAILYVSPIILDSFLLYVPMINEDAKCLMLDENLKKLALVYRSSIDLPYVVVIIAFIILLAICTWRGADHKETRVSISILLSLVIIADLPIPQIAILVLLPRMKQGSKFLDTMKIMNTLIVLQYVLRVYPFYRHCKQQNKEKLDKSNRSKSYWVLGATNFVMYITACHKPTSGLWYFNFGMEISDQQSNDSDLISFAGYLKQESAASGPSKEPRSIKVQMNRIFDNPVFIIGIVFPIIFDSLLLYIPIINEDAKCLMWDENLKKIALVFRSYIDLPYVLCIIVFIVFAIRTWRGADRADHRRTWVFTIVLPLLIIAALPIPQIAMLVFLPRMKQGSKILDTMKIMNSLIVLQFVMRVYPFFNMCKELNKEKLHKSNRSKSYWVLGAINFVMYITACHVLGAFWYFYALQREIDCWIHACKSENGCEFATLDCDDHKTFRNVTLLNDLCPINPSNATVFDFGIYLDALQSGMLGSTDFPQNFLQCFSWGLRNLSSFGSNLKTSTYAWENLFVALISISGLLLFIYLLGHLQTFMQTTSSSVWLHRKTIPQIRLMLSEYKLPDYMDSVIWRMVRDRLEDDKYFVENIYSLLPEKLKRDIKLHLCLPLLKHVTTLEPMDKKLLKKICENLEPMNFNGINYIIRQGEPLDMMFFVLQGTVITYTTNNGGTSGSSSTSSLEKGDYYGERLLSWAAASTSFLDVPISPRTVKSQEKVEVFAITATKLQLVVSEFSRTKLPSSPDNTHTEITIDDSNLIMGNAMDRLRDTLKLKCLKLRNNFFS